MGGVSVPVTVELLPLVSSSRNRELQQEDKERVLRQESVLMPRLELDSAAAFRNAEILVEMYVVNLILVYTINFN